MKIRVNTAKKYEVLIGSGLLGGIGKLLAGYKTPGTAVIINDETVSAIYGKAVRESLESAGFRVLEYTFPGGEISKNLQMYADIMHFFAHNGVTRTDTVIAFGGGVVGDIAGFAAATYMRGMDYIQVPTTLLAMVDSSVGGKTGIDLPDCKNMVGAFHQPLFVVSDTDVLSSLPACFYADGCAEIVKYAILYDKELFASLEKTGRDFDAASVIARCVTLKAAAVEQDEKDRSSRKLLNLGHTVAHAVESLSNYSVTHGSAVSIGIAAVCRASEKCGILPSSEKDRILSLLKKFGLPTETEFTADEISRAALYDKKRCGDRLALILPKGIGSCSVCELPGDTLAVFLRGEYTDGY